MDFDDGFEGLIYRTVYGGAVVSFDGNLNERSQKRAGPPDFT
jgi:hypothetical protein